MLAYLRKYGICIRAVKGPRNSRECFYVTGLMSIDIQEEIARFRNDMQDIFADRLKVKMHVQDLMEEHPGENALTIFLTSGVFIEGDTTPQQEEADGNTGKKGVLVGKSRDFQRFLNKEGPSYDGQFMLDLEINYDTGTCTIHNINLPLQLRKMGVGGLILEKTEGLAGRLGMTTIYAPSEHRATNFWLKNGYHFYFAQEKTFYEKNANKSNLYVAYDLRKRIAP